MTQAATDIGGGPRGAALFDRTPYFHAVLYASGGRNGSPEFSARFVQLDDPSEFNVHVNNAKPFKVTDSELARMTPEDLRDRCIKVALGAPAPADEQQKAQRQYTADELDTMTTAELQDLLTSMGRPTYGNKAGLARRVLETQEIRRQKAEQAKTVQA